MSTTIRNIILGVISGTWQDVTAPDAAFSWLPFTIQRAGGQFRARPDWTIDAARPTGTAYYVSTAGSDSNDGLTAGAPLRRIATAYNKADVVEIRIAAGVYGVSSTQNMTKNISLIGSGTVIYGGFVDPGTLTFALDGTYTHTYKATRSNVGMVRDTLSADANGDTASLTLRTSAADVEANPGSWYLDGSNVLWIRRADGAAVTDTNCRIYFSSVNRVVTFSGANTFYVENVQFEGGNLTGAVLVDYTTGVPTFYGNGCSFKYCQGANGFSTYGAITYLQNCVAARNYDDGFNYHLDGAFLPYAVEINCTGRDNGSAADIDNGSSIHDGGSIVRLMGDYARNVGRNVHDVTSGTTSWNLGCYAHDSTSAVNDCNWAVGTGGADTAKMWLDTCRSSGSATDIEIAATASAYIHQFAGGGVYSGTPIAY